MKNEIYVRNKAHEIYLNKLTKMICKYKKCIYDNKELCDSNIMFYSLLLKSFETMKKHNIFLDKYKNTNQYILSIKQVKYLIDKCDEIISLGMYYNNLKPNNFFDDVLNFMSAISLIDFKKYL